VNGQKIPFGTQMEVPMHAIHTDPLNYASPSEFQPFRFAQEGSRKPLVTLDDTFLSFGYSRHACPGRWFGAHLMKIMMAYLLMEFDFELLDGHKPTMVEVMEFRFPKLSEKIRIRKRFER
jgi:cytochrome P450